MRTTGSIFYSISFFFAVIFGIYDIEKVSFSGVSLFSDGESTGIIWRASGIWNSRCIKLSDSGKELGFTVYASLLSLEQKKVLASREQKITVTPDLNKQFYALRIDNRVFNVTSHKEIKNLLNSGSIILHDTSLLSDSDEYSYFIEIKPVFSSQILQENALSSQALWDNQILAYSFRPLTLKKIKRIFEKQR
ncbi:MAG: hypothetical protein A2096_06925 [Spirochaetes bacterium GWF1_41_5]|nr:MAG: hypothetical protein A2096_06925 [Spirochaetes bacterium GWF1_41_5]HBE04419.1 hypothetical protein [Spirochaetia bacterium]